ncbi:MAG TPA: 4'-phosphopantetheinyl transferase superfamily protein [Bryobacteraceae bacterium]|jgi:4'-phosphopantetheinyl transferase|nr:4'-phosphopantetheinyl transferase superfamily protein [Bryobacteraceae bacterium]
MNSIENKCLPDPGKVHLWLYELTASARTLEYFRSQLSPDELDRADRFCFPHLQLSFVIAHGVLRSVLSKYLGKSPAAVEFSHNPQGKPRLRHADCRLEFNLSHSGTLAACAVARDCEIGVDVEKIRAMPDLFDIARRFFSPEECVDLAGVPLDQQEPAFFNCWTRKEAYIKAIGGGLSIPLDSFQVSLLPNEPARLLSNRENDAQRWNLQEFDPGAGYRGAVAYTGAQRGLVVRRIKADEA